MFDAYDAELKAQADSDDIGEDLGKAQQAVQTAATPHAHGKLGSPGKCTTTSDVHLNVQTILTLEASTRV